MKIEVRGNIYALADARTLADLRELVKQFDEWGLRDDCSLDWGSGYVYIDISPENGEAEPIHCGDHVPVRKADGSFEPMPVDFIINAHSHEEVVKPWYEQGDLFPEQRERFGKPEEPSRFDWPARDRYQRLLDELYGKQH